ncbi:MAG: Holliday junction branch migration protein RuvA [Actinomycetota bacterium]|nr:Holliday junction branch migration protein RuvA [Actinomycetota bacterium]
MIATVRGEVLVRREDHVVIEASGVGYRLTVSSETLRSVPAAGQQAFLHAETISRDDSINLYGFASEEERDLFNLLIGVSGIGPKVAIATLSGGPHRELTRAIIAGDAKRFQAVPGIGKRTAERIILELKDRVTLVADEAGETPVSTGGADARGLARDGLVNLGYQPLEAEQLLDSVTPGADATADPQALIAAALKHAAAARRA